MLFSIVLLTCANVTLRLTLQNVTFGSDYNIETHNAIMASYTPWAMISVILSKYTEEKSNKCRHENLNDISVEYMKQTRQQG